MLHKAFALYSSELYLFRCFSNSKIKSFTAILSWQWTWRSVSLIGPTISNPSRTKFSPLYSTRLEHIHMRTTSSRLHYISGTTGQKAFQGFHVPLFNCLFCAAFVCLTSRVVSDWEKTRVGQAVMSRHVTHCYINHQQIKTFPMISVFTNWCSGGCAAHTTSAAAQISHTPTYSLPLLFSCQCNMHFSSPTAALWSDGPLHFSPDLSCHFSSVL